MFIVKRICLHSPLVDDNKWWFKIFLIWHRFNHHITFPLTSTFQIFELINSMTRIIKLLSIGYRIKVLSTIYSCCKFKKKGKFVVSIIIFHERSTNVFHSTCSIIFIVPWRNSYEFFCKPTLALYISFQSLLIRSYPFYIRIVTSSCFWIFRIFNSWQVYTPVVPTFLYNILIRSSLVFLVMFLILPNKLRMPSTFLAI